MTLDCWAHGQEISHIFPIKISPEEAVEILREVIKGKNLVNFRNIDTLALYKVFFPSGEDNDLADVLGKHTISHLGKPLQEQRACLLFSCHPLPMAKSTS